MVHATGAATAAFSAIPGAALITISATMVPDYKSEKEETRSRFGDAPSFVNGGFFEAGRANADESYPLFKFDPAKALKGSLSH